MSRLSHPPAEDSESVSLVSREAPPAGSYTEEAARSVARAQADAAMPESMKEMDYVDADVSVLSQFHEDAIAQVGFGRFQAMVFALAGLGLAADAIEVYQAAYVIPTAEKELCMDERKKGWLGSISFIGMMIGGLVWGNLADRLGRRKTLLSAMSTNALFGVIAAFMPNYALFMLTRLCSGIGVGGSLPIVFTYYSEFLVKKNRGRHLGWLLLFWAVGGIFCALMAWAIIPKTGVSMLDTDRGRFSSWRVFLLVCAIPSLVSTVGLVFLPESPRYLLEVGRDVEAMFVYQKIFKKNHINKPGVEYQLSELELPSRRPLHSIPCPIKQGLVAEFCEALENFWQSLVQIFCAPYVKVTVVLLLIWTTLSFGFFGMTVWFPEYIHKLEAESYRARTYRESNFTVQNALVNASLENTVFQGGHFSNVRFSNMLINHCLFENCTFTNCTFSDVRSSRTVFRHCVFAKVFFVDTDFYEYKFHECHLDNSSSFLNNLAGCTLDFDANFHLSHIFLQNLAAQLALVPGNLIASYIIDKAGRVRALGTSLFLTSVSAFFIWFLGTRSSVIAFEAVFNFISVSAWNAVVVITTESYPASLRSTGYGFLSALSRLSAIVGSVTFGSFIETSKAVPILTTAAVLLVGGIASIKLPETKDVLM